jgi:pyruvate dehydrogenase E1 component alpha subunit
MDFLKFAFERMLVIRRFEERVETLFTEGVVTGTTHPAVGQEATAVGVATALENGDWMTSNHRGHAHFLARGGDPNRMMAELFGRKTGYARGLGGSQLMADYDLGFLGGNGITAGSIPIAVGAALSATMQKTDKIAVCFFGDGASNEGAFHEGLNLAGIWKLPVLFVCENNQYAMSTPVGEALAIPHIAERAESYGFKGVTVNGNDVEAVKSAASEAAKLARTGGGPTLLECKTYRLSGHSRGDPRKYRTREEEHEARHHDPLTLASNKLKDDNLLDEAAIERLENHANQVVQEAEDFARNSPFLEVTDPHSLV